MEWIMHDERLDKTTFCAKLRSVLRLAFKKANLFSYRPDVRHCDRSVRSDRSDDHGA